MQKRGWAFYKLKINFLKFVIFTNVLMNLGVFKLLKAYNLKSTLKKFKKMFFGDRKNRPCWENSS